MNSILQLFKRAEQGIQFKNLSKKLRHSIEKIHTESDFKKTYHFIAILYELSLHSDYKLLASSGYVNALQQEDSALTNQVIAYIFKNFKNLFHFHY